MDIHKGTTQGLNNTLNEELINYISLLYVFSELLSNKFLVLCVGRGSDAIQSFVCLSMEYSRKSKVILKKFLELYCSIYPIFIRGEISKTAPV